MELKFNKNENAGSWVAEFEATADFNLHIEGVIARNVSVLQKTAGGKYDVVHDLPANAPLDKVIDYDFTALIYPKTIKVVCKDEPTYAEVISEGEIVEMKFQEKVVDVTANGSTVVTPDAGFTGLSKVSVKVDVPSSGGGESGGGDTPSGGGKSELVYYDISGIENEIKIVVASFAQLAKIPSNKLILPTASIITEMGSSELEKVSEVAFDFSLTIITGDGKLTLGQFLSSAELDALPRLTEEEFYTF